MTRPDTSIGNHMLQYAIIGDHVAYRTEKLSDQEVRSKIRALGISVNDHDKVQRLNRCPTCEAWTTTGGSLREIDCPAVKEAAINELRSGT